MQCTEYIFFNSLWPIDAMYSIGDLGQAPQHQDITGNNVDLSKVNTQALYPG